MARQIVGLKENAAMAQPGHSRQPVGFSLRLQLSPESRLGPGKVALLEAIEATGSISAAGRAMTMSYRRAWLLVDDLNRMFREPLVAAAPGGAKGGGAHLTPMGRAVVGHYRALENKAMKAAMLHIDALQEAMAEQASS